MLDRMMSNDNWINGRTDGIMLSHKCRCAFHPLRNSFVIQYQTNVLITNKLHKTITNNSNFSKISRYIWMLKVKNSNTLAPNKNKLFLQFHKIKATQRINITFKSQNVTFFELLELLFLKRKNIASLKVASCFTI